MNDGRKPTVVVAEDDPVLRLDARLTLEDAGFEVIEAADAPTALAECARRDIDVLFTDVQMPGPYCGLDLARRVHERWPAVLLFVTSGALKPTAEELPDYGRFIPKPYEINGVARDLRAAVG